MPYRGQIRNGVVVLDHGVGLPEGAIVVVTIIEDAVATAAGGPEAEQASPAWLDVARALSQQMPRDLPTDFAEQHDHYIHGRPKR